MRLLENKVGMVTGGGSGIGRATCLRFAGEGARVLVVDIDDKDGMTTVGRIREAGGEAAFACADVASEDQVAAARCREWR